MKLLVYAMVLCLLVAGVVGWLWPETFAKDLALGVAVVLQGWHAGLMWRGATCDC